MQAGKLRERIALESRQATRDEIGGETAPTWKPEMQVWAAIDAITGREVHAAAQLHSAVTLRVVIRKPDRNPQATWRILWNGEVLSIVAVLPHPQRDRLTLLCSQGIFQGDQ